MELETYLNALEYAAVDYWSEHFKGSYTRRRRQGKAFRSRILRMDADLHFEIEMIEASYSGLQYEMEKALKEKDKRIAELEDRIQATWWDQDD